MYIVYFYMFLIILNISVSLISAMEHIQAWTGWKIYCTQLYMNLNTIQGFH